MPPEQVRIPYPEDPARLARWLAALPGLAWIARGPDEDWLAADPVQACRAPASGAPSAVLDRSLPAPDAPLQVALLAYPDPPGQDPGTGHLLHSYAWAIRLEHGRRAATLLGKAPPALRSTLLAGELPDTPALSFRLTSAFAPDSSDEAYDRAFHRIQALLAAGDAYQVNLARRYSAGFEGAPLAAYLSLAELGRATHGAYLDLGGGSALLSRSPESFLELSGDRVTTRPIKGTRRRGKDPAEDAALKAELLASEKDRAENLMIVDLMRNDLGRVCRPGTVRVPGLFHCESTHNVHHLVSTVEGRLADGTTPGGLFDACFPGGSVTGAPKRRACEIIREVEASPRSAYCGSVVAMTPHGLWSSITIRTLLARQGRIHCWGGGGIVADSRCAEERQEAFQKVAAYMHKLSDDHLIP